jgi:glucans biosynthesis protein C
VSVVFAQVDDVLPQSHSADGAVLPEKQSQRIHYLDNLRALAMLLGVFLHAGLAYAQPAQAIWLATDPQASVTVDATLWFIHLFRMGLFFLLSGYFAKLVIERKGLQVFVRNRCLRIFLPFVLFYPFLLAAMTVVIVFALSYLAEPQGLMGLFAAAAKDGSGSGNSAPGTMHLWFLYYLLAFSAIASVAYRVAWLNFEWLFRHPWFLWLSPMLLVPAVLASGVPLPAPESFIPQWWPFAFYGLFYFAGWQLFERELLLDSWRKYTWHFTLGGLALYVPYYVLMPELNLSVLAPGLASRSYWLLGIEALLTAYLATVLTIASLLLGKRYLTGKNPWLSFFADSSYWVYLMHLPIVLFLQTLLVPLSWPVWLKLSVVLAATFISCLATYVVFVRYTPLGWLLHGKRSFP